MADYLAGFYPEWVDKEDGRGDPRHNKLHTGYRHAVAQSFVPCAIRRAGDVCSAVRKALEPFALQRCEAANEVMCFRTGCVDDTLILTDVLITDTFFISAA